MSTRRLEPKELQRAFARGPRQDLEFLIPSRGPTTAAVEPAAEVATPIPEVGAEPSSAKPRRTTRRKRGEDASEAPRKGRPRRTKKAKASEAAPPFEAPATEAPTTEAPTTEAPVIAPVIENPVIRPVIERPVIQARVITTIALRPDSEAPWAPASAPWPRPTLLDRALRRVERFVGRVLLGAA